MSGNSWRKRQSSSFAVWSMVWCTIFLLVPEKYISSDSRFLVHPIANIVYSGYFIHRILYWWKTIWIINFLTLAIKKLFLKVPVRFTRYILSLSSFTDWKGLLFMIWWLGIFTIYQVLLNLNEDGRNNILRSPHIMSALRNYDFFNHFEPRFLNRLNNGLCVLAIYHFII